MYTYLQETDFEKLTLKLSNSKGFNFKYCYRESFQVKILQFQLEIVQTSRIVF